MKTDLDSIIIIIVTLLFLVITGLSRRRRKKPIMKSTMHYKQPSDQGYQGKDLLSDAVSMINDPFAKLEKIFDVPEQPDSQEAQSLEEIPAMVQKSSEIILPAEAVSQEIPVTKAPQSLEVIVDEVADYLMEKEIEKSAIKTDKMFDDQDLTRPETGTFGLRDQKKKTRIPVFENVDEIKKAVIYSEILNRKDY